MNKNVFKKKQVIYLSGTGYDSSALRTTCSRLQKEGYTVICPGMNGEWDDDSRDILLEKCSILFLLNDWKRDERTKRDYKIATGNNMMVVFNFHELDRCLNGE